MNYRQPTCPYFTGTNCAPGLTCSRPTGPNLLTHEFVELRPAGTLEPGLHFAKINKFLARQRLRVRPTMLVDVCFDAPRHFLVIVFGFPSSRSGARLSRRAFSFAGALLCRPLGTADFRPQGAIKPAGVYLRTRLTYLPKEFCGLPRPFECGLKRLLERLHFGRWGRRDIPPANFLGFPVLLTPHRRDRSGTMIAGSPRTRRSTCLVQ